MLKKVVSFGASVFMTKRYGVVTRNGKEYIRDYKRELKNGKGLTLVDAWFAKRDTLAALLEHKDERHPEPSKSSRTESLGVH